MHFKTIIHPAEEGGYWAEVPALPGCFSQGETKDEVLQNIREAIEAYLAVPEPFEIESLASVHEVTIA